MPRYVAFLRAINVGGRVVAMATLKKEFEKLGFSDVETFIASGNVIFRSPSKSTPAMERRIEAALEKALGYQVSTFVRTDAEVLAIAQHEAFPASKVAKCLALNVAMTSAALTAPARKAVDGLSTDVDAFHVNGREVYWMCQQKQSESKFSNAVLEKALKVRSTVRGINTMQRLAKKLG